ncbi:uncharacterized protein G2W53_038716 [Senna tora]|uniref:Uncharacterized protein n=1 Tax=Senna tora TaxID=362788 RepID=A0A834W293_9FABA|nr:uncharacterized protein G2W53_038716 [Senna tora]
MGYLNMIKADYNKRFVTSEAPHENPKDNPHKAKKKSSPS